MPLDRNKLLRYQVLNTCFQDTSRQYRSGDLVDCCNRELQRYDLKEVSKRTVQLDVQTLQAEPYNVSCYKLIVKKRFVSIGSNSHYIKYPKQQILNQ